MKRTRSELINSYGFKHVIDMSDAELLDLAIATILRRSLGLKSDVDITGEGDND